MRMLAFSGLGLVALAAATPALAEIDSTVGAPPVVVTPAPPMRAMPPVGTPPVATPPMATPVPAPLAKRAAYVRPGYGYQLPRDWMTAEHFIADPRRHGLERPAPGFGWSRYFDDMVLTDQWGRVYAARTGYGSDRDDRSDDRRHNRDTDGVVGGVAGAAVGAVAGNVIAGAGSRLAGSLIGGGVGALIGLGVELATKRGHRGDRYSDYDDGYRNYGMHWSDARPYAWGYAQGCGCETVTTTTTTYDAPKMVRSVVYRYETVRARPAKIMARPTKIMAREPAAEAPRRTIKHTRRVGE